MSAVLRAVDCLRYGGPPPVELVDHDRRVYWGGSVPLDERARAELDVTDMQWHLKPFAERPLYHELTGLQVSGSVLRLEVALANGVHRLPPGQTRVDVVFRFGSRAMTVLGTVIEHATGWVRYAVEADLRRLPVTRPGQTPWSVVVRTRVGDAVNEALLSARHGGHPPLGAVAVPIRPRRAQLVGDRLMCSAGESGGLQLRLENSHPWGSALVRLAREGPTSAPFRLGRRALREARAVRDSREAKLRAYAAFQRLPVKPRSVFFEAYGGRRYADSPRYVYEELVRCDLPFSTVWAYRDSPEEFPVGAKLVRRGSWSYFYELARAGYWVDNGGLARGLPKRAETTFVQTWRGTPFTRPPWEHVDAPPATREQGPALAKSWDVLLTPSEFHVDTFARSTDFQGRLLRCGLPRNDRLVAGAGLEEMARLRERLELPADRRIVLYAPSPRSRRDGQPAPPWLRLSHLALEVGDEFFVLVRSHLQDPLVFPRKVAHFARPADRWHDVNDLLLVADVLITDYSSIMFDYALLGRPMIFFAYDRERYERRYGTYLDLSTDVPGPVVATTGEVAKCLLDLDTIALTYRERLTRFREEFGEYDTGAAAQAVVADVFARAVRGG